MKYLEVIIPVKNEQQNIEQLVRRIDKSLNDSKIEYGVIFIDDFSTDQTVEEIKRLANSFPIQVFMKQGKPGKAYSILEGALKSKADYLAMIDGDLQYAPEAIPEMFEKLKDHGVVVAKRISSEGSKLRRLMSKSFSFLFAKVLFGIEADVQSGLKLFRREILDHVDIKDISPWTLDLPLLFTALELGYSIGEVEIVFKNRENGQSKINVLGSSLEIASGSLKLRYKNRVFKIDPENDSSMKGSGVIHKRKRFVTHTSLEPERSALVTFYPWQIGFFGLVLAILISGLFANFLLALQIVIAVLSAIYFIDSVFNLYLVLKSLHAPPELGFSEQELAEVKDFELPVYSVLCPLYREAQVLPGFLEAMAQVDWPKDKLDVQLLLEEDDVETIQAVSKIKLPAYVRVSIVPDSQPKTKPKACNFGLAGAKGEFVVVYDAEDIPEPMQLKKAYLAFLKSDKKVICMQAKLNYFNPHQNLLTRFFTAEYSLWFDVILPGFQSIATNIPLGGTSNHFKIKELLGIQGWDPFNVTEDCDLGIRLFMDGYQTALIDSTTLEEANSNFKNWIRQRSRWIKGYMQTYLVHMRNPISLLRRQGWHFLIFQLVIGARITFGLINPILWVITISYFTAYAIVGPSIEALYPPYVFYPAVLSLVFGNFSYLYFYMIGSAKREHYPLIKYVFLIPLYWVMWSVSSFMALQQLITKPHFWEKTVHGLHLKKEQIVEVVKEVDVAVKESEAEVVLTEQRVSIRKRLERLLAQKKLFISGSFLVLASVIANFSNFIFNAFFGRTLSLEDYGLLSLFTSLAFITGMPLSALTATIAHKSAYLFGKYSRSEAQGYLQTNNKFLILLSVVTSVIWALLIPFMVGFFHSDSVIPFIVFTPFWSVGLFLANTSGYLKGTLSFGVLGVMVVAEAVTKLLLTVLIVSFGLQDFAVLAIPLSILVQLVISSFVVSRQKTIAVVVADAKFEWMFFVSAIISGISSISFLGLDIILAKHYLSPVEAGQYGILSLVGKISFFFSSLLFPFIIPLVSKNEGEGKSSKTTIAFLLGITLLSSGGSVFVLTVFGGWLVPLLFGAKAISIVTYLPVYMLAVGLFTVIQPVIAYYQAKKDYSYSLVGLLTFGIQLILINSFHRNITEFVFMMLIVSSLNLVMVGLLFGLSKYVSMAARNLNDLHNLFFSNLRRKRIQGFDKKRILILNWRDIKHKWAGGAESYIQELAKRWVEDGNEVTIFCGNDWNNPRNEVIEGVQIVRRGGFYTVYFWAFLYYILRFKGKFDLVIDSANGISFFTPLYVGEPKFLLIHHIHQEVFREHLIFPLSLIASLIESKLIPFVYKNQKIITVSNSSKKEILKIKLSDEESIEVVNPGVNLSKFKRGEKEKSPTFLYLGRLKPYKNVDTVILAFVEVVKKYPEAVLKIAGFGESLKTLMKLTQKLGLEDSVKFLGRVNEVQKSELFASSWAVLQPSMIEGWGITVIEANASGTPVIASDVNGLRDSVVHGRTGILVKAKSVKDFSDSITKLIRDQKLRKYLSDEAYKWAQNFDWEKQAGDFFEILKQDPPRGKQIYLGKMALSQK